MSGGMRLWHASISWLWDGGIDVKLGDALNGYKAEGKVSTFAEAATWLRDRLAGITPIVSSRGNVAGFLASPVEVIASSLVTCGKPD